ncbi:Piso0_002054 [Millerozyma farinosa CBS 7064]|uniref:Piso0_002054 protein n=1 Tax=Pichia sorbitophila (strain ATCC MYA-4447 / BCRC 22081 / CBS 7064 / NBRC 10061 / NRRL Y-12695) TaxID=559304 RepID=G8YBK2_PICSO|nr:Piso0_002054 [Millerozyma farinosa CBS 7064]
MEFVKKVVVRLLGSEGALGHLSPKQRWALGLFNLSAVVLFWVLSSYLVNELFKTGTYRKPFFMTYLNTGCFIVYLIPFFNSRGLTVERFLQDVRLDYNKSKMRSRRGLRRQDSESYGSNENLAALEAEEGQLEAELNAEVGSYETVKLSLQFTLLWFTANLVTNASLSYTSVTSQTILSTTSSFFTLIIGYIFSVEKINQNKIAGILLSFAGVVIVTEVDYSTPDNPDISQILALGGNLLALSGAAIYGIYTILLKIKVTVKNFNKEKELNTHLFFGFVGLFSMVFLWPVIIILHLFEVERFALPKEGETIVLLSVNALITLISDYCWCKAVLLTSPLTVTVGLSLTIPIAMVGDWILEGFILNWWYLFGAFIVGMGFFIINKDEENDFVSADEEVQHP